VSDAPPTIVVADLHLSRGTPREVGRDFARLLERHADARVIVAGDLFDLATETAGMSRERAVEVVLETHPEIRRAMGRHLDRGGELWLAPGNHDPDLGRARSLEALLDAIGPSSRGRSRLRGTDWFFRVGGLHVEHGHVYDPDNAPAHPLILGSPSLGTHFCVEFLHPTQAHDYLLTNESTPGKLFLSAFQLYGRRGPQVVFRYFYAAFLALVQSGPLYRGTEERARGLVEQRPFAARAGVPEELVERLCALTAEPTLTSLRGTFARLYLDRALATVATAGGLLATLAGRRRSGAAAALLGAAALSLSWARGHDRYQGNVSTCLAAAAQRITDECAAELVVFGHSHREDEAPGYANTCSFAHPRPPCEPGRPYLEIRSAGAGPRARRRRVLPD
jgi:hypothetical protein